MKKITKYFPFAVLILLVFGLTFASIFGERRMYSPAEKRMLATMPKISKKRVLNGKFQKKYETYLSDQFPARDAWIRLKTNTERLIGKTESNGVYFGKKQYLLEKYTADDFDKKQMRKNLNVLSSFVDTMKKDANVQVMMVPSKTAVLKDYLPTLAVSYNEDKLYKKLEKFIPAESIIDVRDILAKYTDEYIYYRTDHHWTTYGAWYAYHAYCESAGYAPSSQQSDLKESYTHFLGSTYAKVNAGGREDRISLYYPEGAFKVIYNLGEKTEDSFYQMEYLEKGEDPYSVFSGGNQGLLDITGGEKNGKTLFIVKDSFANCLIPYLMKDYEQILVVDMRHINAKLSYIMAKYRPTDILVLYNIVQFMQDTDWAAKE